MIKRVFKYAHFIPAICMLAALSACKPGAPSDATPDEQRGELDLRPVAQDTFIDHWPAMPMNYAVFDWRQRALDFYGFITDESKESEYRTMYWNTTSNVNLGKDYAVFNIPDYYGDIVRFHDNWGANALNNYMTVLGASLVGMDMTKVDTGTGTVHNFVDMLRESIDKDLGVVLQNAAANGRGSNYYGCWFFDMIENLMYFQIGDLYPDEPGMMDRLRASADMHYDMVEILLKSGRYNGFDYDGFNFRTMTPIPQAQGNPFRGNLDGGFGAGLIQLWAYDIFGDEKYLEAAKWCMDWYEESAVNRFFDNNVVYGPYLAARLNAEYGTNYTPTKYMQWAIDSGSAGIGMLQDCKRSEDYDYYGLMGFLSSYGGESGRAYYYESVTWAYLIPAVKYDVSLANAIGKWILHLASNARFFYPDQIPAESQQHGDKYIDAPEKVIPYESLSLIRDSKSDPPKIHYANGDPSEWLLSEKNGVQEYRGWGAMLGEDIQDLAFYDGVWVGPLGSCVSATDVPAILRLDLNKLDFWAKDCYPTYLYYNPLESAQRVTYEPSGDKPYDLYDAVSHAYAAQNAVGGATVSIPASASAVLVELPAGGKITSDGNVLLCDGAVVTYLPVTDRSLSFGKPTQASSSEQGRPVSHITDGIDSTQWRSAEGGEEWVAIDLEETCEVNRLSIDWGDSHATDFSVQISADGENWTTVGTYAGETGGLKAYPLAPDGEAVAARAVRVEMTAASGGRYEIRSARIDLWFEGEGVNVAKGAAVTTNSQDMNPSYYDQVKLENVVDGQGATRWAGTHTSGAWIVADIGREVPINEITLQWSGAYATEYKVSFSTDGETYITAYSTKNGPGGVELITLPETYRARYIKLDMEDVAAINGVKYGFSLCELEARYRYRP